jgi:hypothetical protein
MDSKLVLSLLSDVHPAWQADAEYLLRAVQLGGAPRVVGQDAFESVEHAQHLVSE